MATEDPIVPVTVAAPENKPKKIKKASVKSKPRTPSLHPPYFEMIKEAIVTLKERTGSSQYAITKFIEENQKHLPANFKKVLLTQLKKFVAAGKLVKVKASYKLPPAKTAAAAALAKKKPVSKPKTSAMNKIVAKPKPGLKPKAAAKPKAVAKTAVNKKVTAKPKAKAVKGAKTATPGKKAPAAKKSAAKKVAAKKTLKPKAVIAKKASGTKRAKK